MAFALGAACASGIAPSTDGGAGGGTAVGGGSGGGTGGGGGEAIDAGHGDDAGSGEIDGGAFVDGMPKLAVAYFDAYACPEGWKVFLEANGRAIVGTDDGSAVRTSAGDQILTVTPRIHVHSASGSVSIPGTRFVLANGGGNTLGDDGSYAFADETSTSSTGIPYRYQLVCKRWVDPPADAPSAPSGMTSFFDDTECPSGWSPVAGSSGRYIVGLPAGGPNGATFGGAPVGDGSLPSHSHAASGSISLASKQVAGASGCCSDYFAKSGSHAFSTTIASTEVNLPYVELLHCVRD